MSPPKFLPNLSTDDQENATFEAKNTNPHAPIPKPGYICCLRGVIVKIGKDLLNFTHNTSISGVKHRWTTLYCNNEAIQLL